jgi:hypothetical protein
VTSQDFTLSSKAYRVEESELVLEDGALTPEWTSIDKTTLNFIVDRVVLISEQLFGEQEQTETVPESEETPKEE